MTDIRPLSKNQKNTLTNCIIMFLFIAIASYSAGNPPDSTSVKRPF
ncbi:hypothetical protein yrohd0001_31320 [Yersinia rohdei ATCC 43380]|nr:hypothetical protein yrohd0001_31320 [Yersinia rohdei ATCC 43380]